jgi:hypothetical protein
MQSPDFPRFRENLQLTGMPVKKLQSPGLIPAAYCADDPASGDIDEWVPAIDAYRMHTSSCRSKACFHYPKLVIPAKAGTQRRWYAD